MKLDLTVRFTCAVCGMETRRHSGWFLVAENTWLDRIKILSWHPVLARQAAMQSVCCEQHLKKLLLHWLTYANLHFLAAGCPASSPASSANLEDDSDILSVGRLMGELSVHRESLSHVWTGSPATLDCILSALVHGRREPQATGTSYPTAALDHVL